jgi:hypothetical protein
MENPRQAACGQGRNILIRAPEFGNSIEIYRENTLKEYEFRF